MVEIGSSGILVDSMKSHKDDKMTRAYQHLTNRLKQAGITPKKHVLDNEVSLKMKQLIRKDYEIEIEFASPGYHWGNASEVVIHNFKFPQHDGGHIQKLYLAALGKIAPSD